MTTFTVLIMVVLVAAVVLAVRWVWRELGEIEKTRGH
jgi:hypothetical protein